jgi:predicted alpha/beta-hydrolase family hydrolase
VRLIVSTPEGEARVELHSPAAAAHGVLLLGHGAGGGIRAPDLQVTAEAALAQSWAVGLVEQPYRVQGRRAPPRAGRLDSAWIRVAARVREDRDALGGLPLVCGGRSSGARVACRTATETGAVGVLCLAFPLQPSGGSGATPPPSRLPELDAVTVPTLVVQGEQDRFGMPPPGPSRDVIAIAGDHSLKRDPEGLALAVGIWLAARS